MKATIDISLYPLNQDYEVDIIDFILRLREYKDISVSTNGMSTQIHGEYSILMDIVHKEMEGTLKEKKAVFILKVASGERTTDNLPEILK